MCCQFHDHGVINHIVFFSLSPLRIYSVLLYFWVYARGLSCKSQNRIVHFLHICYWHYVIEAMCLSLWKLTWSFLVLPTLLRNDLMNANSYHWRWCHIVHWVWIEEAIISSTNGDEKYWTLVHTHKSKHRQKLILNGT